MLGSVACSRTRPSPVLTVVEIHDNHEANDPEDNPKPANKDTEANLLKGDNILISDHAFEIPEEDLGVFLSDTKHPLLKNIRHEDILLAADISGGMLEETSDQSRNELSNVHTDKSGVDTHISLKISGAVREKLSGAVREKLSGAKRIFCSDDNNVLLVFQKSLKTAHQNEPGPGTGNGNDSLANTDKLSLQREKRFIQRDYFNLENTEQAEKSCLDQIKVETASSKIQDDFRTFTITFKESPTSGDGLSEEAPSVSFSPRTQQKPPATEAISSLRAQFPEVYSDFRGSSSLTESFSDNLTPDSEMVLIPTLKPAYLKFPEIIDVSKKHTEYVCIVQSRSEGSWIALSEDRPALESDVIENLSAGIKPSHSADSFSDSSRRESRRRRSHPLHNTGWERDIDHSSVPNPDEESRQRSSFELDLAQKVILRRRVLESMVPEEIKRSVTSVQPRNC